VGTQSGYVSNPPRGVQGNFRVATTRKLEARHRRFTGGIYRRARSGRRVTDPTRIRQWTTHIGASYLARLGSLFTAGLQTRD